MQDKAWQGLGSHDGNITAATNKTLTAWFSGVRKYESTLTHVYIWKRSELQAVTHSSLVV